MSQTPPRIRKGHVRFQALGGLGEVGMNCALLETEDCVMMIDCGVNFPEGDHYGIDVLIPDFSALDGKEDRIVGLVVTHGHMDHIGAIPYLLRDFDIPVYGPRFALALVREMLDEHGLLDTAELHEVAADEVLELDDFAVEFIHSNHSIPDTLALSIETPAGRFVHTGDFKVDYNPVNEDPIDLARFAELGDEGVRCLFSDSTNIERSGFAGSESTARTNLMATIRQAPGQVFVAQFSTNIFRLQAIVDAAEETDRKVVPLGYSLNRNLRIARELGLLKVSRPNVICSLEDAKDLPSERLIFAVTGSQGEPRAALTRIARDDYRGVRIEPGARVIFSARVIPGNERGVYGLMDDLIRRGAEVITTRKAEVHVSGHACREEQKLMLHLTRPEEFVPVHGDHRFQMQHAELARSMGVESTHVVDNGAVIEFGPKGTRVVGQVSAKRIMVEGGTVGDADSVVVRERIHMARLGMCVAWVVVDRDAAQLAEGPTLITRGITEENAQGADVLEGAREAARKAFADLSPDARRKRDEVAEAIRVALRRYFRKATQRKPLVEVIVHRYG